VNSYIAADKLEMLNQEAHDFLAESGNCAQTAFAVLDSFFQLDGQQTLKALAALPGVALRGETCGAVLGCLMAIGLACELEPANDRAAFLAVIPPARRFCRAFESETGSTMCAELLTLKLGRSFELSRSADFLEYVHCGGVESCGRLVGTAVQIAAEIIAQEQEQRPAESGMWYA
jgi:C_GCAxxG_C_C family probable redox protein